MIPSDDPLPAAADDLPPDAASGAEPRRQRADGAEARQLLLHAALRLFAEKGFAKTSTREIAQAAGANLAAIRYYFGDKAGLYRAAYTEPLGCRPDGAALAEAPGPAGAGLRPALHRLMSGFITPLQQGERMQQCMRLHFRELVEPTGLWSEEINSGLKPAHAALVELLGRHLGIAPDDGLHRLAFSVTGLAIQLFVTRDVVLAIRPALMAPAGIDAWLAQLVDYAEAMVGVEAARRGATPASTPTAVTTPTPTPAPAAVPATAPERMSTHMPASLGTARRGLP